MKIRSDKKSANIWRILTAASCGLIFSCTDGDIEDIKNYVALNNAVSVNIEPMPKVLNYKPQAYRLNSLRDPFGFTAPPQTLATPTSSKRKSIPPTRQRKMEVLENYTLSSLQMVGVIEKENLVWGLLRTPDNRIVAVRLGEYIGKRYGVVLAINEDRIEIEEKILNDSGRWVRRNNSIQLSK